MNREGVGIGVADEPGTSVIETPQPELNRIAKRRNHVLFIVDHLFILPDYIVCQRLSISGSWQPSIAFSRQWRLI
jgi:hypothetical protein